MVLILGVTGCYKPEKRVDFDLQYTETRDQATEMAEIAPGLSVVLMHSFQNRVYMMFQFDNQKFRAHMPLIATLEKPDGTRYQEEFTMSNRWLRLAFVDDATHIRWMQDDLISLEIDGHLYKLYDKTCIRRGLKKMYMAAENPQL